MQTGIPRLRKMVPPRNLMRIDQFEKRFEERLDARPRRGTILRQGAVFGVDILNISGHGVMVEGALQPQVGETLIIALDGDGSSNTALVRWCEDGRIGLSLED